MKKKIYRKPQALSLGELSAAEGACVPGGGVTSTTFCGTGQATYDCEVGNSATVHSGGGGAGCNNGLMAGVCVPGTTAFG